MKLTWNKINSAYNLILRLFGEYKLQIATMVVIGILSGLLGGLGIGVLIPLISFAVNKGVVGNDFISHLVQKIFYSFGIIPSIHTLLILIAAIFVLKAIFLFIFSYINMRISNDCENNYRKHFYEETLEAGWPYLLTHKIGHLENMLMVHVEAAPRLMNIISNMFLNFTNFFVFLLLAFRLSYLTTILVFVMGGVLLIFSYPFVRRTKILSRRQSSIMQAMAHEVNENVMGLKTLKAMSIEKESSKKAMSIFEWLKQNKIRLFFVKRINSVSIEPLGIICITIIFSVLYEEGKLDLGVFAVLIYIIQKIFAFVEDLQGSFHSLSASLQFVKKLIAFDDEIKKFKEINKGEKKFVFEEELKFDNVTFGYSKKNILENLNIKVGKGEMLGIIGPSGAGKTTIVDLLLRLFDPISGELVLDGVSAKNIDLKEWRKNVGYVSQDIFLKNDSVFNNIKFYDEKISETEVFEAAKAAYIYDFISGLPEGFNTVVGERGLRFSAGERQRIVLARVFARHPKILILDEATSALDNESEAMIKKAIYELKGEITIIAIAHRLSTIMNADRLIVLEKGKVIEEGIPSTLLGEKNSYFYRVYNIIQEENV